MATWRNWGRTAYADPAEVVSPRSTAEVALVVQRAAESRRRVKAVGSGHSFTGIAVADDIQLDPRHLSGVLQVDLDRSQVTFAAGTPLHQIPAILDPLGLAMPNLGDIDRQTLSGAISTGTHGTGLRYGGLATQVAGVRLVTGSGELMSVDERENSELLPAVALGLGALGVLVDVTLQCVPAFSVAAVERAEPVRQVIEEWSERVARTDHFEFYWFPHTDRAVTKSNSRGPADQRDPRSALADWIDVNVVMNGAFRGLCNVGARVPAVVPALSRIAASALAEGRYTDRSDRVFVARRPVQFREMEYGVDLDAVPSVQRELERMIERRRFKVSFPVEFRAAAADSLHLSTANGRETGYVAVHRFWREDPTDYFAEAERIFLDHGGRPHWGKMHSQTAERLRGRVPGFESFLVVRDRLDPGRVFTNRYLRDVLGD